MVIELSGSAYSCGSLTKYGSEKVAFTTLERETARLERSLTSAQNEIQNAQRAADKLLSSVPKQIEDVRHCKRITKQIYVVGPSKLDALE